MSTSNPPTDILLLGATGFTGSLCARYLAAHRDRQLFSISLAARSKDKLDTLISKLQLDTSTFNFKALILDVTKPEDVDEIVKGHSVVINTVGPFRQYGTPVVGACARHGVHYVDLTGEAHWIKEIITKFDFEATKTGAIIIPGSGFDSIPSDMSAYLSAKALHPRPIDTSSSIYRLKGGFSGGTLGTIMDAIENVPRLELQDAMKDWSLSPMRGRLTKSPGLVHSQWDPEVQKMYKCAFFLMAPINTKVVQRTCGLLELEARQNPEEKKNIISYGDQFRYEEFMQMPGTISAALFSVAFGFTAMCLIFVPPARWLLKKLVPSGSGPTDQQMEKGSWRVINITSSLPSASGEVSYAKTTITAKGDPGYLTTAIMICESALLLIPSAKPKERLTTIGKRGGILTSVTAFGDALVESLRTTGRFEFESRMVADKKQK